MIGRNAPSTRFSTIIFRSPASFSGGVPRTSWIRRSSRSTSGSPASTRWQKTTRCEASTTCRWPQACGTRRSRNDRSVRTRKCHGCRPNEDGVRTRARSSASHVSSGMTRPRIEGFGGVTPLQRGHQPIGCHGTYSPARVSGRRRRRGPGVRRRSLGGIGQGGFRRRRRRGLGSRGGVDRIVLIGRRGDRGGAASMPLMRYRFCVPSNSNSTSSPTALVEQALGDRAEVADDALSRCRSPRPRGR
jgi:hypothetical protein